MKNKKRNYRKSNILRGILSVILCVSLITSPLAANASGNVTDNSESTTNEPQIIVTIETTNHGNGSSTETETTTKTWTEQNTNGTPVDPQAAPAEGSSSVSTVTTSGTETTIESTTTDDQNRVTENSGTVTGTENTVTDTTTTNVTIDENQTVIDTTTTTTTVNGEVTSVVTDGETVSTGDAGVDTVVSNTESTGWIPGETPAFTGADEEEGWNNGTPVYSKTPDKIDDPAANDTETSIPIEEPSKIGVTLNMTPGSSDSETVTTVTLEELVSSNIKMPTPGVQTEKIKDEQGNVIGTKTITTSEKKDASGNVIGYDITTRTETVKETGREVTPSVPEAESGYNVSQPTETAPIADKTEGPVTSFILPEKPAASSETDPVTGNSTITTVEDILDEAGNHVGYRFITVVSNNGKELSRSSNEVYGTHRTINITTETTVINVEEVRTKVYATVTVTEVIDDKSETSRSWSRQWSSTFSYDVPEYPVTPLNDDFPIPEKNPGKDPGEEVLIELIDEEVPLAYLPDEMIPLASVPRTGDLSVLWAAMILLSALGLITLNILDRKRRSVH